MVDVEASVADITDPTKARLVAQCDIENDVDRLINFEFDEGLGYSVPVEKVDGANEGIQHSFLMTEDAFASGDRQLVNHKTYYYVAVAYAHNEFKSFDPTDPLQLDGQKIPYISSRLSFDGTAISAVSAVPHNPSPEADGTIQNIEFGSSPIITRVDGYGNGGRDLELTQASKDYIIANGFMAEPSYDFGKGPIAVKVVDPLNVLGGYYECKFEDYSTSQSNGADTASWSIERYDVEGGTLLETVTSQTSIDNNNEQIIAQWGVSVQINQDSYYLPDGAAGGSEARTADFLNASIEFADSSQRWLSFVTDNDAFFATNWIRSGDYTPTDPDDCLPDELPYLNPCNYADQIGADNAKDYAGILQGGIAPHRVVGYEADYMPMAYYNFTSVTTAKKNSSISFMPSVDIILTNDQSKWTRCPVVELGRDNALNVGGAQPGQLRKSPSVGKDGLPDNSGTTGMGWFPGYAIDLESGARLYMAFGENSFLGSENGADMVWNPTDRLVDGVGTPLMGGMHPIYVYTYKNKTVNNYLLGYDFEAYVPADAENLATNKLYQDYLLVDANNTTAKRELYSCLGWIAYPLLSPGETVMATDVTIKLRIGKEYKDFSATGTNSGRPMYSWNMDNISTATGNAERLADALSTINVVPNPYNAYSEYETSRLDTRVKITNLPERCNVNIYSVNGKLVRGFKKDSPVTSLDWDLNNNKGIPVAGGVYLIHVDVPGVGERVLKFFAAIRQVDLQGI